MKTVLQVFSWITILICVLGVLSLASDATDIGYTLGAALLFGGNAILALVYIDKTDKEAK